MSAKLKQKLNKEIQVIFNRRKKSLMFIKDGIAFCGFNGDIALRKYKDFKKSQNNSQKYRQS